MKKLPDEDLDPMVQLITECLDIVQTCILRLKQRLIYDVKIKQALFSDTIE